MTLSQIILMTRDVWIFILFYTQVQVGYIFFGVVALITHLKGSQRL